MVLRLVFAISYLVMMVSFNFALEAESGYFFEKLSFLVASIFLLAQRKIIYTNLALLFMTLSVIFITGSLTRFPEFEWGTLISALNQIFVIYAILSTRLKESDHRFFLYLFSAMPLANLLLGSIYHLADIHPLFIREYSTGAFRLQGTLIPAYLAGVAMCGVVAAFYLAFNARRITMWPLVIANLGIAMLAGGRATLFTTVLICGALVFLRKEVRVRDKAWLIFMSLYAIPPIIGIFGSSLLNRILNSGSSNRDVMWDHLARLHDKYRDFGIGYGHQYYSTPRDVFVVFQSNAAHNEYLKLLVELGTIGAVLFFVFLAIAMLLSAIDKGRIDFASIVAGLSIFILFYSENVISGPYYYSILLVMSAVRAKSRRSYGAASTPRVPPSEATLGLRSERQ